MKANRREVLVALMVALGGQSGIAFASDGAIEDKLDRAANASGKPVFYGKEDFQVLEILADAIIPRTDTPGALDAKVPAYLDAMMASWASADTKRRQLDTMTTVRARLRELGGGELAALAGPQRLAAIAALDAEAYAASRPASGSPGLAYRSLKGLIAQVYYSTEIGATQELQYKMVPGRWIADAPLSEIGRAWAF